MKYRIIRKRNALGEIIYTAQRKRFGLLWRDLPAFKKLEFNSKGVLDYRYTCNDSYYKQDIQNLIQKYVDEAKYEIENRKKSEKRKVILESEIVEEYE